MWSDLIQTENTLLHENLDFGFFIDVFITVVYSSEENNNNLFRSVDTLVLKTSTLDMPFVLCIDFLFPFLHYLTFPTVLFLSSLHSPTFYALPLCLNMALSSLLSPTCALPLCLYIALPFLHCPTFSAPPPLPHLLCPTIATLPRPTSALPHLLCIAPPSLRCLTFSALPHLLCIAPPSLHSPAFSTFPHLLCIALPSLHSPAFSILPHFLYIPPPSLHCPAFCTVPLHLNIVLPSQHYPPSLHCPSLSTLPSLPLYPAFSALCTPLSLSSLHRPTLLHIFTTSPHSNTFSALLLQLPVTLHHFSFCTLLNLFLHYPAFSALPHLN